MNNTSLPFRFEDEKTFLSTIHPLIRFLLPFILVVPFLLIDDIYLIFSIITMTFIFSVFARLNLVRVFSRIKSILPFIFLITIFLPLYIGNTIAFQFNFIIPIVIYEEGLLRAFLLFMRIFGSIFVFMTFFSSLTYSEFIEAITTLRIPSFFVGSFVIMLHYIPIIAGSNKKILEAQELRGKKITNYWQKLKTHAYIMGKTLVMNLERSEKLYDSLKMRGFTGKLVLISRRIKIVDFLILALFFIVMYLFVFVLELEVIFTEVFGLFLL